MEDLDALLADLGGDPTAVAAPPKPAPDARPASSFVDLDELESLMNDLSAPSKASGGAAASAPADEVRVSELDFGLSELDAIGDKAAEDDDLDQLMASLTSGVDATPAPKKTPEPTKTADFDVSDLINAKSSEPAGGDDLDSLLSNLSSQMENVDEKTMGSRGTCHGCKKAIAGEVLQAMDKDFHPNCFACGGCKTPIGTADFYVEGGAPYCVSCYGKTFSKQCGHCAKPILDKCLTAMGKSWHPDCFKCTVCLSNFSDGSFFEKDGQPLCSKCFHEQGPKCGGCGSAIIGECINALGQQYHQDCFVCSYCKKSFNQGQFFSGADGKPLCETHYHAQSGSVCAGCGKAITGKSISAFGNKYHLEHFVCAFCLSELAGKSYKESSGKPYCSTCHSRLFST